MNQGFSFDLQLFAESAAKKTTQLSDIAIQELSLVFAQKDGKAWAPRNPDAVVLATKAGEKKVSFLDRFAQAIKGYYVKDGVPDNIDGDGDGAEDYELILGLITGMSYDLQNAMWMSDEDMRSAAIVAGIDNFLVRLDDVRSGGKGKKAGAKHSKATKEHIDAMADHLKATKEHIDAMADHLKALGADTDSEEADDADKAAALAAAGAAPPVATDPPAATPPAITPPTDASKAGEVEEMKPEQIQAMIDTSVAKAAEQMTAAITGALTSAKAAAQVEIDAATAKAEAEKRRADEAEKAAAQQARKPTAASSAAKADGEPSRLQRAIKAQLAANPESTRF